jgi:outer membrane protein TolC
VQVAQTYYNVLDTQKEIANLKTTIGLTKQLVGELQKRVRIGRSRLSEVLSARSQLAVSESQLQSSVGQKIVYIDQLSLATNMDPNVEKNIQLVLDLPGSLPDLGEFLKKMDQRPDLQSLQAQLNSQLEGVKVARSGHWPTLGFTGNYYLSQTGSKSDVDWDASLSLSFPLFEGGLVNGQVREATEKQTELTLALNQAKRAAEADIRSAYHSLKSSLQEINALEKAVTATEKNYKQQQKDYRFSLVTNLDVLEALSSFHNTKLTLDKTKIKAAQNWAQLQASVAEIPE